MQGQELVAVPLMPILVNLFLDPFFTSAAVVLSFAATVTVMYYVEFIGGYPKWISKAVRRILFYEDIAFCFVLEKIFGLERIK